MTDLVLSRRSLVVDDWDRARHVSMLGDYPRFAAEAEALATLVPTAADLWADVFAAFDLPSPTLVDLALMDSDHELNHLVVATLLDLPEFALLRTWSVGDAFVAAAAAIRLRPTIEVLYDRAATTEAMRRAAEAVRARLATDVELPPDAVADLEAAAVDVEAAVEDQERRDAGERQLELRSALREAADAAAADAALIAMVVPGGAGEARRMKLADRLALARRLNTPPFARMADVFGALKVLVGAARHSRIPGAPGDPGGITYGRDLTRVLPSALVMLADPDLEVLFYRDYAEGALPMRDRVGTQEAGRGGIVCNIDSSGTMAASVDGHTTRDQQAKAMGLVLLNLCRAQRRPFHGILFGDTVRRGKHKGQPELVEFDFSRGYSIEAVLDFAELWLNGGTNFMLPLDRSLAILAAEHAAKGHTEGDIVFITDGMAPIRSDWAVGWLACMEHIGARLWVLLVAGAQPEPLATLAAATGGGIASYDQITDPGLDLRAVLTGLVR